MADGVNLYYNILTKPFIIFLPDAWKSPINLTQESHERVKRSLSEPPGTDADHPKVKRPRLHSDIAANWSLESVPADIVCTRQPADDDAVPRVLLSQVQNVEGLERVVE